MTVLALGAGRALAEKPTSYWLLQEQAPSFEAPLLGGGLYQSGEHAGRFQIIYFWGLWCPDCILDAAYTKKLGEAFAEERRVGFLALHCGPEDYGRWRNVGDYAEDHGITYQVAFDPEFAISETYAIEWFPTYILIDPTGRIVHWETDLGRDGWIRFRDLVRERLRAT